MGKKFLYGIAIAIVSILIILGLSFWQYQRIRDAGVWLAHTNQVLYRTQSILNTETQYELNIKNYLLTGDSGFLRVAGDTLSALPGEIDSVRKLTADNANQQTRIDSLRLYSRRNTEALDSIVRLSKAGNFSGPVTFINTEAKEGNSHYLSGVIGQMEAEERHLLTIRREVSQERASELNIVLWALAAAVLVLILFILPKIKLDIAREKEAVDRLHRFNRELEEEVRRQTAQLQASQEKYKTLFYKSPLPKWIYNEDTLRFVEVNDAAVQLYGYSQEEFTNLTLEDIRPAEDLPQLRQDIEMVRQNRDVYFASQWRHLKKNGEIMDVQVTAHPIQLEGHKARLVAVIDITDRKRYEARLRKLNADLEKRAAELSATNGELERFAYIASHDLQEPLRMITSFLQLLQKKYKGQLDGKADQYIHYAVDGAERMKALILDLLEYSRVGTGKENFTKVDTAVVMQEVGDIFRERIIALHASMAIDPLPVVWGDKLQLMQLLQNLVGNALKYHSDRPPEIRIGSREEPGHWLFCVQDNGIGIDPQFFEKIFIIFQRLHNKNDYSGTGIGLAICKKIVERHGGKIWVESAPDKGSTFYFTISKKF
jgi:PAS domain S-box-containing protein